MKKNNRSIFYLMLILIFGLTFVNFHFVQAQETEPIPFNFDAIQKELVTACIPVELVIVFDQSESMDTSDPYDYRITAAESLIDLLYQNAALTCNAVVTHRIAVIGFADYSQFLISPTEIYVEEGDQDWQDQISDIADQLRDGNLQVKGQTTNIYGALLGEQDASAINVFRSWREIAIDGLDPKRMTIVVSDGAPCSADATNLRWLSDSDESNRCREWDWVNYYLFGNNSVYGYRITLDNFIQEGFPTPHGLVNDITKLTDLSSVNMLLFGTAETFGDIGKAYTQITQSSGGDYFNPTTFDGSLANIDAQMYDIVGSILSLNDDKISECKVEFYLEPYRSSTTIISSVRPNRDSNLIIITPNGEISYENLPSNVQYNPSQSRETFIIDQPLPGAYQLNGDPALCDSLQATVSQSNVRVNPLPIDDVAVTFSNDQAENAVRARLELITRSDGTPFANLPMYPLNICGEIRAVTLKHDPSMIQEVNDELTRLTNDCLPFSATDVPGIWESEPLPAPRQGTYSIRVFGTVKSIRPSEQNNVPPVPVFYVSESDNYIYTTTSEINVGIVPIDPLNSSQEPEIVQLNNISNNGTPNQSPMPVEIKFGFMTLSDGGEPEQWVDIRDFFYEVPDDLGVLEVSIKSNADNSVEETVIVNLSSLKSNELSAVLRAYVPTLDPEGLYDISIRLTQQGLDAYNKEKFHFVMNDELPQVQVLRMELNGVLLRVDSYNNSIWLNSVNPQGIHENQSINNLSVTMIDQSERLVNPSDVFDQTDDLVFVHLFDPSGIPLGDAIPMSQSIDNPSKFEANVIRPLLPLDTQGDYQIRFFIDRTDNDLSGEKRFEYTVVSNADHPENLIIERTEVTGLGLNIPNDENVYNGAILPVNSVSKIDRNQRPVPLDLRVQIIESNDGEVFSALENLSDDDSLVVFDITGPSIDLRDIPMSYSGSDGIFEYTFQGKITSLAPERLIDSEGDYTVNYRFRETGQLGEYHFLERSVPVAFYRFERKGIDLILNSLARVEQDQSQTTQQIPLFTTIWEAMGTILLPLGARPLDVEFCLQLVDTNGVSLHPDDLLRDGVKVVDPNQSIEAIALEDTDTTVIGIDQILEVIVTPTDTSTQLDASNIPVEITSFDADEICGLIDGEQTRDGGTFRLSYGFKTGASAYINDDRIQILSSDANFVDFERRVTDFWLNPDFWIVVEWFLDILLGLWILNLLRINFLTPMHQVGTAVKLKYAKKMTTPIEETYSVRKWFWFRQVYTIQIPLTNDADQSILVRLHLSKHPFSKTLNCRVQTRINGKGKFNEEFAYDLIKGKRHNQQGITLTLE